MEHAAGYVQQLLTSSDAQRLTEAADFLKNVAIGSNKQKAAIVGTRGLVARLLQIIDSFSASAVAVAVTPSERLTEQLLLQTTALLASLAKGSEDQVRVLLHAGSLPVLVQQVLRRNSSARLLDMAVRALSCLLAQPSAPHALLFEWNGGIDEDSPVDADASEQLVRRLLSLPRLMASASRRRPPSAVSWRRAWSATLSDSASSCLREEQ